MDGQRADNAATRLAAGIERQQAGDLAAAAEHYKAALAADPDNADALHLLGVACYLSQDPTTAVGLLQKAFRQAPNNAEICSNLGAARFATGDIAAAAEAFRAAATLNPGNIDAHANLATALAQTGQRDAAIESYTAAQKLDPANPRFVKRLGELCLELNRFEEAADWSERCVALTPDDADAHSTAAFARDRAGRPVEAETHYRRALALKPGSPEIANNLGALLARTERADEAATLFAQAFAAPPDAWQDPANHAGALCNQGKFEDALPIFEALATARPNHAGLRADQAQALIATGRHAAAAEALQAALAAEPARHDWRVKLAHCLLHDGLTDQAVASLSAIPDEAPDYLRARLDLCMLLAGDQRHAEAAAVARAIPAIHDYHPGLFLRPYVVLRECCDFDGLDGLEVVPEAVAEGNLAACAANFLELLPWAESEAQIAALADLHRRWGATVEDAMASAALPPLDEARRTGPIRLGFISSDLRRHAVARFVLPLIEHYDRGRFEIFCYAPRLEEADELQRKIRDGVTAFTAVGELSDRDLAAAIRDDHIDILFELNGLTAESRLATLAWRAAPVQANWLGYPFTTGLSALDYILLDGHIASDNPDWLVEAMLPLGDSSVSYDALENIEPALDPPAARNGFTTFGSLSSPYKITRRSVKLWAAAMRRVANSRFFFIHPRFAQTAIADNLIRAFAREGIERERLDFMDNQAIGRSHFDCYADIDIVLDTMPLTGGTTTCDALWMGVPVVTRRGPSLHQRLGHGHLMNVGLAGLSTGDDQAFVDAAVTLAGDTDRLSTLRRELRDRMRAGPLGDGAAWARAFCDLMEQVAVRHGLR